MFCQTSLAGHASGPSEPGPNMLRRMLTAFLVGGAIRLVVAEPQQHELCDERFLFQPLLAGRDVAVPGRAVGATQQRVFSMAKSMQNLMYVLGDAKTGECVAVDACYDPEGVVAAAESLGCNVTAAIGTHWHYDHIGHAGHVPNGPGLVLPGLDHFAHAGVPCYIHQRELSTAATQIGVEPTALTALQHGDVVRVGAVELRVIHTPGHSPGGLTLVAYVDNEPRLALTGDTIFPGSCGRLDLPGADVDAMYDSLRALREVLDDGLPLFPGHAYSGESSTVGREKAAGFLRPMSRAQWRRMMQR